MSAGHLAGLIRSREVSSEEAVEACLARIATVNPRINAVVAFAADALDRARDADARLARGENAGPLHGVPFTIKDSIDTAGVVTTAGSVGWRDRVPDRDATVVARLRAAGGILLGKTNTPEFTWSDETDNDVYGRTNNPYDLERTPGGSSGGAAAIVAAGGVAVRHRQRHRRQHPPAGPRLRHRRPQADERPRAADRRMAVVRGDRRLAPAARPARPPRRRPRADPADHRRARRRGSAGAAGDDRPGRPRRRRRREPPRRRLHRQRPPDADAGDDAAVEAAAAALGAAGARVEWQVPPGLDDAWDTWDRLIRSDGYSWLRRLIAGAGTEGWGSYETRGWIDPRPPVPGDELSALLEHADAVRSRLLRWFHDAGADAIVCPAMPQPAIRHGESNAAWFGDTYSDVHNLTGWPAVVVRGGTSPDGLPIGVQLVARPWREDVALAAARVVETACGGWQPPVL